MSTSSRLFPSRYSPENWSDSIRWALLPILPPITAVVFYFLNSIVNSIMSDIPTALVSAIAVGLASVVYVGSAVVIAPSYRHLVGVVFGSAVVILAVYLFAMTLSDQYHASVPRWYGIVLTTLAAAGAITATAFGFSPELRTTTPGKRRWIDRLPHVLRWVLAMPAAILSCALLLFVELAIAYFSNVNMRLVLVENYLLMSVVFMAVITVIVPRGKSVIGIALASIWGLVGLIKVLGVAIRPFLAKAMEAEANRYGETLGWDPGWYLILQGLAAIVASLVIIVGAVEAAKEQRAKRLSTPP